MPHPDEIAALARILRNTAPPDPLIRLAEINLTAQRRKIRPIQYNNRPFELLRGKQDYQLTVGGAYVELSGQLYRNINHHYRLFAYARCGSASGMLFSLNLTTGRDAEGIIALSQRLRFSEGRITSGDAGEAIRRAKTRLLADVLVRSGIPVTDNLEVELGLFSSPKRKFLNTTPSKFLSDFFSVALLKGHMQGNKGFQFGCLPRFDDSFAWKWDSSEKTDSSLRPNAAGLKGTRSIPLALRFRVLERDEGRCCACGRTPLDGITLHVDHIVPFSLGGLTVLSNLQTLCAPCNLGKSNRSRAAFV